ncbi:arginine repressor [Alicyclobacillus sp. SO9]|nr:arginine repressor [Alicyclobacillus sp. SO9]
MRIKEIVSQHDVETQDELIHFLEMSGFSVTQATISRDIKELQLLKVVGRNGRYKYAIPMVSSSVTLDTLRRKLTDVFVSLARANNLLILKVMPGNAHSIGAMLDNTQVQGLLGTIAGDDTLLLICTNDDEARMLENWLTRDEEEV